MINIWTLLAIPIATIIVSKLIWGRKITLIESALHFVACSFLILILYLPTLFMGLTDTYYVHGHVTKKYSERVHCRHSYSCNCVTSCSGSGQSRSCSTYCQTCYRHSYDIDWNVVSTVGRTTIDTVDWGGQGKTEPPRWTEVKIGEPYTVSKWFTNYLAAAKQSLWHRYKDIKWIKYPTINDYYRYRQVFADGISISDYDKWNELVTKYNSVSTKNVNVVLFLTSADNNPTEYIDKVVGSWKGLRLNDVVVALGMRDNKIEWANAATYGLNKRNELLVAKLRSELVMDTATPETVVDSMFNTINSDYVQLNEKEFEYLKDEIHVSLTAFIILTIIVMLANIGAVYICVTNEESE